MEIQILQMLKGARAFDFAMELVSTGEELPYMKKIEV